ncbi:MAG TPA: M42 family metallopeptidase [Planctomycetota bacterium]|nr:M42 family metallopeptidase [Planctomycetota bacterium]
MEQEAFDFLKRMLETPSPSGFEMPVQKLVRERLQGVADEISTDVHGNVIAAVNPGAPLRVMLAGHCDEIGLMVQHVLDDGFINFSAIGGVDTAILAGQRVVIHNARGPVAGVVGRKPIHLLEKEERDKPEKIHKMWIDIGAKNKDDAMQAVEIGDPITVAVGVMEMRNGLVAARGFDDRIGAFVVIETLRRLKGQKLNVAVYGVSTVQEELGLRGARTSAFGIDPHVGIAVDVGFATDHPAAEKAQVGDVKLGLGPVLHRGPNINHVAGRMLIEAAKANSIPYQMTAEPRATGTDANAMQINRAGCAAALMSVPNRYMHTPVEVVSKDDVENCSRLLAEFCKALAADTSFIPG